MDYNLNVRRQFARWKQKRGVPLSMEERFALLPQDPVRVICQQSFVTKRGKGKKTRPCVRVVDSRIWAKLDGAARSRWLDTIRAETPTAA